MMQQGWRADFAVEAGDPGVAIENGFLQGQELRKRLKNDLQWSRTALADGFLKVECGEKMRFGQGVVLALSFNAGEAEQGFRIISSLDCLVIIFARGLGFARRFIDSAKADQVIISFALFFK